MNKQEKELIRILLADDHGIVRNGLCRILEDEKDMIVVGEASTGRECVQKAENIKFDIILMDITMPDLNGIEATRIICERFPKTRVLILSMHHTAEHVFRAFKAGAVGYVLKHSVGQEVTEAIRTIQTGKRYLSTKITDIVIEDYVANRQMGEGESQLEQLSMREREIFQLVAEGYSSKEIAKMINLSIKTVETYRSRLMGKLSIKNIPDLVRFAIKNGIISIA